MSDSKPSRAEAFPPPNGSHEPSLFYWDDDRALMQAVFADIDALWPDAIERPYGIYHLESTPPFGVGLVASADVIAKIRVRWG